MPRMKFVNVQREGPGNYRYRSSIELDGNIVGHVERDWSMGGYRAKEYVAKIGGAIVASAETLADLRTELREHFVAEGYPDARESW